MARNLPEDNGASNKFVGTSQALKPILNMNQVVAETFRLLDACDLNKDQGCHNTLVEIKISLARIPSKNDEKSFKRMFDEFSGGVSYRQQYMDKNAFLIYYTKGFDGPDRPSIETDTDGSATRLAELYGYRNEAWIALDDAMGDIEFALSQPSSSALVDVRSDLTRLRSALAAYLALVPPDIVAQTQAMNLS